MSKVEWPKIVKQLGRRVNRLEAAIAWVRVELAMYTTCERGMCADCDILYRIMDRIERKRLEA